MIPNSDSWCILTLVKMQEGNWGDIEKVFQKTHVYLWFIYHNITNSQAGQWKTAENRDFL